MSHLWIFHLVCESHFRKRSWVFISLQRLWSAETFSRKWRRHESGEPHLRRIQETGDATMDRHPPCSAADARQVWSDSLLTLKWLNSVFVFKSQDGICPAVAGFISDSTSWSFSQNWCFWFLLTLLVVPHTVGCLFLLIGSERPNRVLFGSDVFKPEGYLAYSAPGKVEVS